MNYSIRELKQDENKILDTFLYEAVFIPEGVPVPSTDIINKPDLQVYVKDFGENKVDLCLVAQVADEIVGAVWVRIMNDYGHIDNLGELVEMGPTERVFATPVDKRTEDYISGRFG